jgi:flagellar protein FlaJ
MGKIPTKTKKYVLAGSFVAVAILLITVAALSTSTFVTCLNELFFVSLLIVLIPSAILDFKHQKWLSAIEDQMPLLVRGVAESQETGMTLTKAFEKVVDNKMISGPLAIEVKQLVVQMSWGTSFEDALTNFKNKINSPIVNRFCVLVLEASRSGGTIKKVFTATSGFMEEMKEIDRDTNAQMKPYIIVIYSAFAVFIVTAILLVNSFFAPLQGSQDALNSLSTGAGSSDFKGFFYQFMIMSALTGGLMAGKIGERRLAGGMKHSILLLVAGYMIFFAAIPPSWV